jgi:hypothetical protein
MRPDSFVLGNSITVVNMDTGRGVVGTIRVSPDAKTLTFRPLLGYGPGPHLIRINITRRVVSFSGNPIPRSAVIEFVTEYDPLQPSVDERIEEFTSNTFEETNPTTYTPLYAKAHWNEAATSGLLVGLVGSGTITLFPSGGNGSFLFPPWGWGFTGNFKFQSKYNPNEMGTSPRTITGYDWYVDSNQAANNASNVSILLGHTDLANLTGTFANNFQINGTVQTPTTCVNNIATYAIPQGGRRWLAGPTFATNFTFQGGGLHMILEIRCTPGAAGPNGNPAVTYAGAWGVVTNDPNARLVYQSSAGPTGSTVSYRVDTRFHWLFTDSESQSKWYDIGTADPLFLDALVVPDIASQPAGTTTTLLFEGAKDDPNNPGNPDPNNTSGWVDNLPALTGFRYVRFHTHFISNLTTNQAPSLDRIIFPFIFYQY